jgi:acetyl esterase/lipase
MQYRKAPQVIIAQVVLLVALVGTLQMAPPILSVTHASAALYPSQAGTVMRDVNYCTAGDVAMTMDIYFPQVTGDTPSPVALYVHGGAWASGSKSMLDRVIDPGMLTSKGFLVASVDYRLAPQYRWPAQIEDVKCAVRYLRANASAYNLDPGRIGAFGESAGGHLTAMLGLAGQSAGFDGGPGYSDQSSRVQAVVDICGPTDFTNYTMNSSIQGLTNFVAGVATERSSLDGASPVSYVDKDAPPFLIIHGEKDPLVPFYQSQTLYDRLISAGARATLIPVKNAAHVYMPASTQPLSPSVPQIQADIVGFFEHTLLEEPLNSRYFPETGKVVRGDLMRYWDSHGGLAQQGYPISEEIEEKSPTNGKTYTVQYFERSVMERHPEAPAGHRVMLALLGTYLYKARYPHGAPDQQPNVSPGSVLFAQTGHRLGGVFLQYWREHGGLAQQGYPISDELTEMNDLIGTAYTVQYFERAVFEYHPENPAPYNVLLSQLGTYRYEARRLNR